MRFTSLRTLAALSVAPLATFVACHSSSSSGPVAPTSPFGGDVPISATQPLGNMSGPVDVVRDKTGMVHIYASNANDLMRVEGYQVAHDRTVQLELIRRVAEGRMAELLGDTQPSLIDRDIAMRTVGLGRVAKTTYDALAPDSELRGWLDAFADGISQFNARIRTGDEQLPKAVIGLSQNAFTAWEGWEPLAIGRLQSQQLSYSADDEIAQTAFVERSRLTFNTAATDADLVKRAGFLIDFVRFAPLDPTLAMDGFPNDGAHTLGFTPPAKARVTTTHVPLALLDATRGWQDAHKGALSILGIKGFTGSNNWIVGPSRTATGHAMVANDPHLALDAPSIFWMAHLSYVAPAGGDATKNINTAGLAFPGIPGIVLGFNDNVAWGATTADYDVTDVYKETFTSDGSAVVFNNANVPLQKVHETIKIAGNAPLEYDVLVVPHHGPIVPTIVDHKIVAPDPKVGAMSVKWTGYQPTGEFQAVAGMVRAKDVEDSRTAMRSFEVGAQNWVFADTKGNIFYSSQSTIPTRDRRSYTWDKTKFEGQLPCFVLPGDGTAEWTGKVDEAFVPHVKNPPKAYVGTANGDQVGVTLDNDPSNDMLPNGQPIYTGCWHDPGYRVSRIHQRIENLGHPMSADDMASIQADARSAIGAQLVPKLLDALTHAEAERAMAGTHADLAAVVTSARYQAAPIAELRDLLTKWGTESDYDAAAGVNLDDGSLLPDGKEALASKATLVFNTWLVRMISAVLDDELTKLGDTSPPFDLVRVLVWLMTADATTLATYDATAKDSALFDDLGTMGVVESRDERAITSLLDALDALTTKVGADRNAWRWGKLHTLRFGSLVSLWSTLSIPPMGDAVFPNGFPRHGDGYNVDVGEYGHRAAKLVDVDFTYSHGPTQRFVADLDPAGPIVRNALPGGEIWDNASPHFRDEAELWRRNQNHPIAFSRASIVAGAEERIQYTPPATGSTP